jgi:quercetin dioxygenase-like cupin family protein
MKKFKLRNMTQGWFVGDFSPTVINSSTCEVAVKYYKKGDYEEAHYHKIATEITVISKGRVLMNDIEYEEGDILMIEPNDVTDFQVLEDTITTVVKLPSVKNDKFKSF